MCHRTLNYKYNVVSPRAHQFCDLFSEQVKEMVCLEDKISRHMRALGFKVPNITEKMRVARIDLPKVLSFSSQSVQFREADSQKKFMQEGDWPDLPTMLMALINNHETIVQHVCRDKYVCHLKIEYSRSGLLTGANECVETLAGTGLGT